MDDQLTPTMEASFDRMDVMLAKILERVKALDFKISLDLKPHSLSPTALAPSDAALPSTDDANISDDPVLQACDLVYASYVSDDNLVHTATSMAIDAKLSFDDKKAHLCTAVLAHDELLLQTHIGDELGDGFKGRREPTSPACPLLHSEVANHGGSDCPSELFVSADAFKSLEITKPLPILESECTRGLVVPFSPSVAIMVGSEALTNLDQEPWKKLGLGVYRSCVVLASRVPHALHLFAEMSHSCWVCKGGTALLDFDLGYHMGIRDKGGGEFLKSCFIGGLMTELCQDLYLLRFVYVQPTSAPTLKLIKAMVTQGFIKNCLVVIFLDSGTSRNFIDLALFKWLGRHIDHTHQFDFMIANDGMVLSHGCSQVHFRVQDYDCVHTVFTLPLGGDGGFEVYNGHTGKEENFCTVYGQELESLRALLPSPKTHSKGLGAIDVLVSFSIIGEFCVGCQSSSSETLSIVWFSISVIAWSDGGIVQANQLIYCYNNLSSMAHIRHRNGSNLLVRIPEFHP